MVSEITSREDRNPQMPLGTGLYIQSFASRLTQTTNRNLVYWSYSNLVTPHIHARNGGPSVYSYNDLLAIRAVVRLRAEKLPLQKIRKAIRYFYANIGSIEWWNLKMVVYRKKDLVVVIPSNQSPSGKEEIVIATRGGQKPIEILFTDLVNDLLKGGKFSKSPKIPLYVDINPRIQGGLPVLKGTRIKTSTLFYLHKCGLSPSEIAELYNGLDKKAVNVAISYEKLLNRRN